MKKIGEWGERESGRMRDSGKQRVAAWGGGGGGGNGEGRKWMAEENGDTF